REAEREGVGRVEVDIVGEEWAAAEPVPVRACGGEGMGRAGCADGKGESHGDGEDSCDGEGTEGCQHRMRGGAGASEALMDEAQACGGQRNQQAAAEGEEDEFRGHRASLWRARWACVSSQMPTHSRARPEATKAKRRPSAGSRMSAATATTNPDTSSRQAAKRKWSTYGCVSNEIFGAASV